MTIPGFSNYKYINGNIVNSKNKIISITSGPRNKKYCKLKDDNLKWKSISYSKIQSLVLPKIKMCNTATQIYGTDGKYYIDKSGNIYSFNDMHPLGIVLSPSCDTNGYPSVNICGRNRSVHGLMCDAFIMQDYAKKGLVCLHKDDDKSNYSLSNLSVGTYSKNNKDAYVTGCNKGNGLRIGV